MQKGDDKQKDMITTVKIMTTTGVSIKDILAALYRAGLQVNYVSKFPPLKHGAYVFRVEKDDRGTKNS